MKDTRKRILQGATLLATVLAMAGYANAGGRFSDRPTRFTPHTVQDSIAPKTPHTVQDAFGIPGDELPRDVDDWNSWNNIFGGARFGDPHLALNAWSEPVEAAGSGPAFDPVALPVAEPLEFNLRAPGDEPGDHFVIPVAGAQLPGPGALPLLGLGTLALFGRRRRS